MSPAHAERRLQQREEARQSILNATESLLVQEGYEAFSIRRLAERCGYAAPTIYHYFGDKPGLMRAVVEACFAELEEKILRVPVGDDPVETLRSYAHAFVEFGLRNPTHYRLLVIPGDDTPPPPSAEQARDRMSQPIVDLAAAGRLRTENPAAAQQALWAVLHGLITLRTTRPNYEWADDLVETAINSVIDGLLIDAPSDRKHPAPENGPPS